MEAPRPVTTVDVVLFTLVDDSLKIGLVRRSKAPHRGRFALPSGPIRSEDRDPDAAARRILEEETGVADGHVEQLYTFGGRARDPRNWSVTIGYCAVTAAARIPASDDLRLVPLKAAKGLPFDHDRIVARAIERLRSRAGYSSLPGFLLPPHFTIAQLQRVYEIVAGGRLDTASFRRKMWDLRIIKGATAERPAGAGAGRPPQYVRLADRVLRTFPRKVGVP